MAPSKKFNPIAGAAARGKTLCKLDRDGVDREAVALLGATTAGAGGTGTKATGCER